MERILHSVPVNLSDDDLGMLLWKAFTTGLDWPALAYYIPEILARQTAGNYFDEEMLLYKLMLATRPDLIAERGGYIGESMGLAEREAILAYVHALFDARLHTLSYNENQAAFHEVLAFMLDFDSPIAPLLECWKRATDSQARINLCLFVTDYLLNFGERGRFLTGAYYDRDSAPLPENKAALDALMNPEAAVNLLMDCADDVATIGADWETGIGAAFDWAVALTRKTPPLPQARTESSAERPNTRAA